MWDFNTSSFSYLELNAVFKQSRFYANRLKFLRTFLKIRVFNSLIVKICDKFLTLVHLKQEHLSIKKTLLM